MPEVTYGDCGAGGNGTISAFAAYCPPHQITLTMTLLSHSDQQCPKAHQIYYKNDIKICLMLVL